MQSDWRLRLGKHVGAAYARNPGVAAALVAGSVSRGHADRFSDVELLVAWHRPPTDEERRTVVVALGADHRLIGFDDEWQCWEDELFVGRDAAGGTNTGALIEVTHQLVEAVERRMADVLERFEPDPDKQSAIHAIVHGVPVHGEGLIGSWAARADPYPRGLALSMVQRFGQIDLFGDWRRYLERGRNLMLIHERFAQVERQLLLVLQAINGQYHYKFKWLDRVLAELDIAPSELGERLARVHIGEVTDGADTLRGLVEDVYGLVETHLPEVDVDRLREIFRWHRPEWDAPLPVGFPDLD